MSTTVDPELRARQATRDPNARIPFAEWIGWTGRARHRGPVALIAALIGSCLLLTAFAAGLAYGDAEAAPVPRLVSSVDGHGRACTTVGDAAIDCDYPPPEARLGGWLEELDRTIRTIPPSSTS